MGMFIFDAPAIFVGGGSQASIRGSVPAPSASMTASVLQTILWQPVPNFMFHQSAVESFDLSGLVSIAGGYPISLSLAPSSAALPSGITLDGLAKTLNGNNPPTITSVSGVILRATSGLLATISGNVPAHSASVGVTATQQSAGTGSIASINAFVPVPNVPLGVNAQQLPPPSGTRYPNRDFIPTYTEYAFSDVDDAVGLHDLGVTSRHTLQIRTTNPPNAYFNMFGINPPGPGRYTKESNAPIIWKNLAGDWADATGALQGSVAFAATAVTDLGTAVTQEVVFSAGPSGHSLLELVQGWVAGTWRNAGLWMRGSNTNTTKWRSRWYTDASQRPFLRLGLTSLGTTVDIPCRRNIWFNTSGENTQAGKDFNCSGITDAGLLWFDLSTIAAGDVSSAEMHVWSYDQLGNQTVNIFRIVNPEDPSDLDTNFPVTLGLAANYPFDNKTGLYSDPSVLWVQQYDNPGYKLESIVDNNGDDGSNGGSVRLTAADGNGFFPLLSDIAGAPTFAGIKVTIHVSNPPSTADQSGLETHWSPWRGPPAVGLPGRPKPYLSQPPERLHLRYYLMFGNNWDPSPDGGKMPGFDARFCAINSPQSPQGIYAGDLPGMGRGNSGSGTDGMTGASGRGNFGRYKTAIALGGVDDDPLYQCRAVGTNDMYITDMSNTFGGDLGVYNRYMGTKRKGQWNCIEVMMQMNSVTDPNEIPTQIFAIKNNLDGTATCYPTTAINNVNYQVGQHIQVGGVIAGIGAAYNGVQFDRIITQIVDGSVAIDPAGNPYPPGYFKIGNIPVNAVDTRTGAAQYRNPFTGQPEQDASGNGVWIPPGSGPGPSCYLCCSFGQGNFDGIFRRWDNGRLAADYNKMRFRHTKFMFDGHVFGIDNVWMCVFEGGGAAPGPPGWPPYSLYISNVVVATNYIGPLVLGTIGGTLQLSWTADPDPLAVGYRVYYGISSGVYTAHQDAGNVTSYQITGLTTGTTYYAVVQSLNAAGVEINAPSFEISGVAT